MVNSVILTGRISHDLEKKVTSTGKLFVKVTLAVSQNKDNTVFLTSFVWEKTAENLLNYCQKGDLIAIEGALNTKESVVEGKKITSTFINAFKVTYLNTKKKAQNNELSEKEKGEIDDAILWD